MLIPKGQRSYFHVPLPQNIQENPSTGDGLVDIFDLSLVASHYGYGLQTKN